MKQDLTGNEKIFNVTREKAETMIFTDTFAINTKGFGDTIDITAKVIQVVEQSGIENGLVTVFCPGSTGAITTIEYEIGVIKDLQRVLEKIVHQMSHMNMTDAGEMVTVFPMSGQP